MKYTGAKLIFLVSLFFYCSTAFANDAYEMGLSAYEEGNHQKAYEIWQKAALKNNSNSQYGLGFLHEHGLYVAQNFSKALFWYEKAALSAHPEAQYAAGVMYLQGLGVTIDQSLAINYFRSAAKLNNELAILTLGDLNFFGEFPDSSVENAEKWYKIASDLGSKDGAAMLAQVWYETPIFKKTPEQIVRQLEYAVSLGSADAKFMLGLFYKDGILVTKDLFKAKYYLEAIDSLDSDIYSNFSLAEIYFETGIYSATILRLDLLVEELKVSSADPFLLGEAYNLLGRSFAMESKLVKAEENFLEALDIFQSQKDSFSQIAMVFNNLGLTYLNMANFVKAEQYIERAIALRPDDGVPYNNFGLAAYEQGNLNLAKAFFEKSLILLSDEFGHANMELTPTLNSLGLVFYSMEDFQKAEIYYEKALEIIREELGEEHQYFATTLGNLANVWAATDQFGKALEAYNDLKVLYESSLGKFQQEYAAVLNNSAHLKSRLTDYKNAILDAEDALTISQKNLGSRHPDLIGLNTGLAKLHFYAGNKKKALHYSSKASALIKNYSIAYNGTTNQNSKSNYPISVINLKPRSFDTQKINTAANFNIAMLINLQTPHDLNKILISFQLADVVAREAVFTMTALRFTAADKKLQEQIRFLQDELETYKSLMTKYIRFLTKQGERNFQNTVELLKSHVNQRLEKIGNIQNTIASTFPRYSELVNPQPLSLSDTQDLLGLDEGLFTFVSDDETSSTYAFMVTKEDARAYKVDLSESDIADIVGELRSDIDLSQVVGIGDLPNFDMNLSYELYSKLFGPAEDMLGGVKHLLVVPTGPMESLPLNLLVTEKPEIDPSSSVFDNYQAAAWLPKSYSLTRLPSVSSLRALRVFASADQAQEPFIGFGDPVLNGQPGELRGLQLANVYRGTKADIEQVRSLPELPETSEELKRIAAYLRAPEDKIYLRERASETVLKNTDLTNSRVVAFATHGLVGGEISGLAEPALVLSPPDEATDEDDGLLKASEVAQLKMNADIIMLSACNTASGDELGAEGLSGLARAFIYAGARSLLVSHWSVESSSAAELTTGMFDVMSADDSIGRSEALQMSMVDLMMDEDQPYYSHPAFWAPFSLIGDGATLN